MNSHSDSPRAQARPKIRLDPVGFWSYARHNEDLSEGRLADILRQIKAELASRFGRLEIFQDNRELRHGDAWEARIGEWIDRSTFFIPILTPHFILSEWCMREVEMFLAREQQLFDAYPDLPRTSRIFPIHYVDIDGATSIRPDLVAKLVERNWFDMRELRYAERVDVGPVGREIGSYAKTIRELLMIEVDRPLTAEEVAAREAEGAREAEARQRRAEIEAAEREIEQAKAQRLREEAEARHREAEALRAALATEKRKARRRLIARMKPHVPWIAFGTLAVAAYILIASSGLLGDDGPFARPAPSATAASTPAAESAPPDKSAVAKRPPANIWLAGTWGLNGNCSNATMITYGTRIAVTTGGDTDYYEPSRIDQDEIVAPGVRFVQTAPDRLKIKYPGYEPEFARCRN